MTKKRRRYGLDEEKIQRFYRAKRGMGSGKDYKPWFTVRDVPSSGRVHRTYSQKTLREHHLLSDNEFRAFIYQHRKKNVIDIREQYPLPRDRTLRIAAELRVKHPVDPYSRAIWVITTDLLITLVSSTKTCLEAYSIKEAKSLLNERALEKLEIERRYWELEGVPWYLLTNEQLKNEISHNLKWLYDADTIENDPRYVGKDRIIIRHLKEMQATRPYMPAHIACSLLDKGLGLQPGECLAALRRSLSMNLVQVDLKSRCIQEEDLAAFSFREDTYVE